MSDLIYKIADAASIEAARASGRYAGMPIDLRDGFLHFSTAEQLAETLKLHFKGQAGLALLAVRTDGLPDLRWEPSRGGQLFPHLYGALDLAAVVHEGTVSVSEAGEVNLPDWVR